MSAPKQNITVRKVDFVDKKAELDNHYFADNGLMTQLLNSFHVVFPEGEKFFIRCVKYYADDIKDKDLQERVKRFIGQEVQHSKEHEKIWDQLKAQGYDVELFKNIYSKLAYEITETNLEKIFGGKRLGLAVTAALEHYTAILAEAAFETDALKEGNGVPENIRHMLLWHAAEEIEHKSVSFDVLQEVDDSYTLRVVGMIVATLNLAFYTVLGQMIFLTQDREFKLTDIFKDIGGMIEYSSKTAEGFMKNLFDYFRPDFHPDQHENRHLAEKYFNESRYFADKAAGA